MQASPSTLPTEEPPKRSGRGWWFAAFFIVFTAFLALVGIGVFQSLTSMASLTKSLPGIAERFKTGNITTTFIESIPEVSSTQGDILELATSRSVEFFQRKDSRTLFWGVLDLGDTVSEIRAPVTYRYHVRLSETWRLASRGNVCMVLAPAIQPSLPPAIHTDLMEKKSVNGWARFNKDDNLTELERSMTPTLSARARNPAHMGLVRAACRESVGEFVKKWLMKEDHWRSDRFSAIVVVFPDEGKFDSDEALEKCERKPDVTLKAN